MHTEYKPDIVLYHNDNDGFGAAWCINNLYKDSSIQYVAVQYDEPILVSLRSKHVLMVDFSLKNAELDKLFHSSNAPASLVILDHHKSAKEELVGYNVNTKVNDIANLRENLPTYIKDLTQECLFPIIAYFDMEMSGCALAHWFCFPDEDMRLFLHYIEDRDLWKHRFEDTDIVHAGLSSYAYDFDLWDVLASSINVLKQDGIAITRYIQKNIDNLTQDVPFTDICGYKVPCLNVTNAISDTCHRLIEVFPDAPFVATYVQLQNKRIYSLRSSAKGIDVSEIAKKYSGGGHKSAAGMIIETDALVI